LAQTGRLVSDSPASLHAQIDVLLHLPALHHACSIDRTKPRPMM
jgi:hypothetical protein